MQVSPDSLRIMIEASWGTASTDYAEACSLFRNLPAPGFPKGKVPAVVAADFYSREIRAETIRRCAARLIRSILVEKGIRTVGPLLILQASLEPGQKFHCTIELFLRPDVSMPDCAEFTPSAEGDDSRISEARQWLLDNAECDMPEPIIRRNIEPARRDTTQPGSVQWDEATHNALLHVIAHEVADRHGITIDEECLEKYLQRAAAATNMTPAELRAAYNKNGQLEVIREFLLIEAALNFLAKQERELLRHTSAAVA